MCLLSEEYLEKIERSNPELVNSVPWFKKETDVETARDNVEKIKANIAKNRKEIIDNLKEKAIQDIDKIIKKFW